MLINSHILITGANGFVGQHLSTALLAAGARVSKIVHSSISNDSTSGTQHILDLTDREKVAKVFNLLRPDYVIHLAGSKNRANEVTQFRDTYDTNVSMSLNVIESCRSIENFKRLVFLGSCDEYGQASTPYAETLREMPISAYGLSKLAVTQILSSLFRSHGFPSVVLRPSVIYGPGQGEEMFVSALIQSLLMNRDFAMTNGEQRRDFVYINDVVEAIIKSLSADERVNGVVLNIGAGVSSQLKEVASIVAELIGSNVGGLIKLGAIQYRLNEVMDYSVDVARAGELLGYHPSTELKVGLQNTVKYFKETAGIGQNQYHA